ncbi:hypothetical protein [Nocardia sp. NPDC059239]|uniref:hypothetical protein n=1 Tax=unclassified Nocardia TaxID=2637762 RepID=UPI00369E9941
MRDAYEYTWQLRGMILAPHKIWLANPKLARAIVPTGAYFQKDSSPSKAEIEIEIVSELASTLAQPRVVPAGMYHRAAAAIGVADIVDVTVLMGWFTSFSLTLAAFDVPSNATGLTEEE